MSANNWTACPKCRETAERKQAKLAAKIARLYGVATKEEYHAMVEEYDKAAIALESPTRTSQTQSLCEDWEIGISGGEFFVDYRANCNKCDFNYEYKYAIEPKL